jgi:3'-phosphoadenosine 5'-phosphosulfate sulfotransferase (PAPS reductase)/FAD synthetase
MAKKCALITVDEILNWPQVLDTVRISKDVNEFNVRPSRYWTEVKEEINKL